MGRMIEENMLDEYGVDDMELNKNPYAHVLTKILKKREIRNSF